jgi:hypothetical protein
MARRKRTPEEVKNPEKSLGRLKPFADFAEYSKNGLNESILLSTEQTKAAYGRDFRNLLPDISGKPGFGREDYEYFRPDEARPHKYKEIVRKCNAVYRNVGLIRNIIDLMGDFTCQGIRLVHPNKRIEQFYQSLWVIWNGTYTSERISNTLYRLANVPLQTYTTKLTPSQVDKLFRTTAAPDITGIPNSLPDYESRELPYKYVILDPAAVTPIGGVLSSFLKEPRYGLELPDSIKQKILAPHSDQEKAIVAQLPQELKDAARENRPYLLDADKTTMLHYKKDDWQTYADPMIYAILDDIEVLNKLKLADLSALDGATSKLRIFKLGSVEHKIAPNPAMAEKLSEILQNNVGAGVTDIVWGPDIDILETTADSYQFLGDAKYEGTLNNIYAGLGIPPTLTGTFGAAGTTNNFISLKTLTERLEYGRSILTAFWDQQIKIVQKTMGFRFPARVAYDRMVLGDEAAEKTLLIQLADRNLISDEMLQHLFKNDPELERIRLKREKQERESGKRVAKAGQWFDPQPEAKLKQIALQTGQVAPSEIGLELEPKKSGEKSMLDKQEKMEKFSIEKQAETAEKTAKMAAKSKPPLKKGGQSKVKKKPSGGSGGRPKTAKDTKKRKTKTFRARSMAQAWAKDAQDKIAGILTPAFLQTFGKKNMRQLTTEQALEAENIKFGVLLNSKPYDKISEASVRDVITLPMPEGAKAAYSTLEGDFVKIMGRAPSLDEVRQLQIDVYMEQLNGED